MRQRYLKQHFMFRQLNCSLHVSLSYYTCHVTCQCLLMYKLSHVKDASIWRKAILQLYLSFLKESFMLPIYIWFWQLMSQRRTVQSCLTYAKKSLEEKLSTCRSHLRLHTFHLLGENAETVDIFSNKKCNLFSVSANQQAELLLRTYTVQCRQ